jgi:hypothetical protein
MTEIPFWAGKNAKLLFSFLQATLVVDYVDIELTREGQEVADPVCGEDRDRLQFITTHYDVTINAMQQKTDLINRFMAEQDALDARTLPAPSAVGILIYPNDGSQAAYQCQGYILGKWKLGIGGRTERNKMAIPGRCRYVKSLPTV